MPNAAATPMPRVLFRLLTLAFVTGVLGTGIELLLLGHTEDPWQIVPLALLALALPSFTWFAFSRGRAAAATLRALMALFVAAGFAGLFLHYDGNAEFELEMVPGLRGSALFAEAMTGATPALAPGAMVLLALIGLACTFNPPARRAGSLHES